jgi:hypothetical protein
MYTDELFLAMAEPSSLTMTGAGGICGSVLICAPIIDGPR